MDLKKDKSVFLAVLENHKRLIYKMAHAYCKKDEDRKDLIQEIIIQLWRSFSRYDDQYKLSTWIYRIALNVSISFYRKENRRKILTNPLLENIIPVEEGIENTETDLILLQQFIAELKAIDKALMILYLEEKSHREIAEILGLTETNIATKINRIKIRLKQKFSNINS